MKIIIFVMGYGIMIALFFIHYQAEIDLIFKTYRR